VAVNVVVFNHLVPQAEKSETSQGNSRLIM
jgi:hypothetical protein